MSEFSEAVKVVTDQIRKDKELRRGYQANIAMQFCDAVKARGLDFPTLHAVANQAADAFLTLWCRESGK